MSGSASHVACLLMPPILLSMGDCRTCDILPCTEQAEGHEAAMGTSSVLVDDSSELLLIKRALCNVQSAGIPVLRHSHCLCRRRANDLQGVRARQPGELSLTNAGWSSKEVYLRRRSLWRMT